MQRFANAPETAFSDLKMRALENCILFRECALPPGCFLVRSDIGFEVSENPSSARILVKRGIRYNGQDPSLQQWFQTGVAHFSDFTSLRIWLQRIVGPAFGALRPVPSVNGGSSREAIPSLMRSVHPPEQHEPITDLEAVRRSLQDIQRPIMLNESDLYGRMSNHVLGQNDALRGIASVVYRHMARVAPSRPAVVFAVGPTGVGKTRTAEHLAAILGTGDEGPSGYGYHRLDMAEYQERHQANKLIGAPPGYIGHDDGSLLADIMKRNPRTVLLFDEIDKAHPEVLKTIMNAMDAGRLTSNKGEEVSCRQAIFFFTSNGDADGIIRELEAQATPGNSDAEDRICRRRLHASGMARELVGRIGKIVVFRRMAQDARAAIVALGIVELAKEFAVEVKYVDPGTLVELMKESRESENFGARLDNYRMDGLLGGVFANTAKQVPVRLIGPPYRCVPIHLDAPSAGATNTVVRSKLSKGSKRPLDL